MPKRGMNIYKRKDGRWEGRYIKSNKRYGYVYARTYCEVKQKIIREINSIIDCEENESLLFSDAAEMWINSIKCNLKESSVSKYESILNKHIYPMFADREITDITNAEIEIFLNSLLSDGKHKLAPTTVLTILTVFKSIFRYTSKIKGVLLSDLNGINIKTVPKRVNVLEVGEQLKLNNYLYENISLSNIAILLCMYTGIRIGEVCALKWRCIHLEEQYISIESTVQRVKQNNGKHKTKLSVTAPKSQASVRKIPIPDNMLDILSKIRKSGEVYLISGKENKIPEPRVLQNHFKNVLRKCGIEDINFHILRHTFATRCVEVGVDIKSLSEILGHSSVNITLNRYVHPSMEIKQKNINLLSELMTVK